MAFKRTWSVGEVKIKARRNDEHVGTAAVVIGHEGYARFRRKRTEPLGESKVAVSDDELTESWGQDFVRPLDRLIEPSDARAKYFRAEFLRETSHVV